MSLILYNTNFKQLDGNGPEAIDLRRAKTIIGRGSQTFPVDAAIFARRNGADIISRRHVEITRSASDVFTITDLMAVNGTFVNSIRLLASQDLNNGDIIQFGGLTSVMTGPDGFCVKYIFRGIGSSSSGQNTKVVSKKAELSKKKVTKKNAKTIKKESTEAVDLSNSNSDYRSNKRVRIDVTNGSNNGTHGSNGNVVNVDNTDENQNMEDNLRIEIEALRKEMIEMKKLHLESRISVLAAVAACKPEPGSASAETELVTGTGTEVVNTTVNETSQKLGKKNLPLSSGSAKKTTEKTTEKNDKTNTPRKKGRGSGEDIVQHSTTIKTPKEKEILVKKEKEDSDRKENSSSRAKESSSRTEYSLMTQSSNFNTTMKCNTSSSGCAIDISSLRSVLTCAICSMVLLDAVVVPCSHGVSALHTVHHTCTPLLNSHFVTPTS
jgi:pSer/pThr/pTyr-binding forkhead associated (FHA) protein